jgi:hypothetical protein
VQLLAFLRAYTGSFSLSGKQIMKKYTRYITALAVAGTLAACGGGGGDSAVGAPSGPAAWQVAQLLETSDAQASQVDVSINAAGVGYAVWQQVNGAERDVFASRYSDGVWGEAVPVSGAGGGFDFEEPQVAVLPDGEALAIWRQTAPFFGVTVFFSKTNQGVWQDAQVLQPDQFLGAANSLDLKADANGNAMAVWARSGATANDDSRIFARYFNAGAFEPAAQQIDLGAGSADLPAVAIDAAGNVIVAWRQLDELNNNVHRIHVAHNVKGKWEGVEVVSNPQDNFSANLFGPEVAAGPNGVASVTWTRIDGTMLLNTSNEFVNKKWKGMEFVPNGDGGFRTQLAMDGLGNTTIVFLVNKNGKTRFNAFRKQSSGGQSVSFEIETIVDVIRLGADAAGRVLAVWSQAPANVPGAPLSMVSSRLDPSTGQWSAPELIERDDRGNADSVALDVNAGGRAIAAWLQKDGTVGTNQNLIDNITANIFK